MYSTLKGKLNQVRCVVLLHKMLEWREGCLCEILFPVYFSDFLIVNTACIGLTAFR